MQIIQSIRDKGAAIIIVVIALSLIGFILMDSRTGSNNASSGLASKIGKVNGHNISLSDFNKRVQQAELQEEQRTQQKTTPEGTNRIREQVWNQLIAENIFYDEAAKLGIDLTSKELSAILLSNDPSNPFLQQGLADQATGKLDVAKAQEALANIKKFKGEQRDMVDAQIIDPLKLTTAATKYGALISASAYYPAWMKEKDAKEANTFSTISYVSIPYNVISDSAVKVTDADIDAYVNKNKQLFKQEAGRKISYVTFSQQPSADDSNKIRVVLEGLKQSFAADTSTKAFVAKNSVIEFRDEYLPKDKVGSTQIDTIVKQPAGTIYGPYAEQGMYVLAKVIGTKEMPDSVKARHILIGLNDPKTGQPIMADSTGKKLADSILTAIKGGADFAALAAKYSTDGSKDKGGDLGTFGYGTMVPEFNEFSFTKPVGSKDIVKTQFGYHVIEILNQSNFKPAYKMAFVAKPIIASDVTINNSSIASTKAAGIKDGKALRDYAAKNGLRLTQVPTLVKENDYSAGELKDARQLVKWAFDAKAGAVSDPFSIGEQFVVATVDKIEKEGVQDAATARSGAEVIIVKQKKAALIKAKVGASPTLESAAAAYNRTIEAAGADSTLTFSAQMISGLGLEPKVIGASFNKDYQAKVSPAIDGTNGVYFLKVLSIQSKAPEAPETISSKAAARLAALRSQTNNWYEGLRKQADIKDERSKIY